MGSGTCRCGAALTWGSKYLPFCLGQAQELLFLLQIKLRIATSPAASFLPERWKRNNSGQMFSESFASSAEAQNLGLVE